MTRAAKIALSIVSILIVSALGSTLLSHAGLGLPFAVTWGALVGWLGFSTMLDWVNQP